MRYPTILFDVGDTLIGSREPFGVVYARVYRELDLDMPGDRLDQALREVWQEISSEIPRGADRYRHFAGGETEFWLRVSRLTVERVIGRPVDETTSKHALERLRVEFSRPSAWHIFDDVVPTLTELRQTGVRLGVVSNWDSRLPRLLDSLNLDRYFETVGVSHLEGCEKPNPDFFRRVLNRMGARPESSLHVGDVPELDYEGARGAGVDCVIVDRHGRLDGTCPTIRSLAEIAGIARPGS